MSVNGTGNDRRNNKPLTDSTSWTVKSPGGVVAIGKDDKPITGVSAAVAFAAVRSFRLRGETYGAVRS